MWWGNREAIGEARKAYEAARAAESRMDGHEKLCAERWTQAHGLMMEIKASMTGSQTQERRRTDSISDRIIIVLLGILGAILFEIAKSKGLI